MTVYLPISHCNGCPHKREKNPYSTDGWDFMIDFFCHHKDAYRKKTDKRNRKIAGSVEREKITPPDWCPLSEDNKVKEEEKDPLALYDTGDYVEIVTTFGSTFKGWILNMYQRIIYINVGRHNNVWTVQVAVEHIEDIKKITSPG